MQNDRNKSLFLEVAAYLLVAAVIGFFAAQTHLLRGAIASHRVYVQQRDARWEVVFRRVLDHIDREEALFEHQPKH